MLLSCLRVLHAQDDSAATEVTELAQRHIDRIAATIADPTRRSYREEVAPNRILLAEPHPTGES